MPPRRHSARRQRRWRLLKGHTNWVSSVVFSPNGKMLASASFDLTVRLWIAETGKPIAVWNDHVNWVNCLAFSPTGKLLASGSYDCTVILRDVATRLCLHVLRGHEQSVCSIAFSSCHTLASGSADKSIRLWDESGRCVGTMLGHESDVRCLAFSPCGKTLASGSKDDKIRLWNVVTGACTLVLYGHTNDVSAVTFSRDGVTLISGSRDGTIRFWHTETGKCTLERIVSRCICSVALSPNGQTLAYTTTCEVILYSVASNMCVDVLRTPFYSAKIAMFAPNGKTLAVAETPPGAQQPRGVLRVWSLLDFSVLCNAVLLFHIGVAPYVLLDIVNFLTAKNTAFTTVDAHMHVEKISFIALLQQMRNRKNVVGCP